MISKISGTIRQIAESIIMATRSVVVNKMRTFLSLLGITIGIFAIISVYTAIDTLEGYIRHSLGSFSQSLVNVGKWPWGPEAGDTEYKWWKFMNRPEVTETEFRELQVMIPEIQDASLQISFSRTLKYNKNSSDNKAIIGATEKYQTTRPCKIFSGRFLTSLEFETPTNSAVIGWTIAEELFDGDDPVGQTMKIGGRKVEVVGVFEKEGTNMFGASWDEQVLVSLPYAKSLGSFLYSSPEIYLLPKSEIQLADFKELVRAKMRIIRRIPPSAEDNFALNDVVSVSNQLDSIFVMINLAGGIIGIFSILVGGFGVANIMFVSVRERTSQIGIQKALGAKPYFILLQFTFEAILLSVVGGVIGLFLIWIITFPASAMLGFEVVLSVKNVMIGLGISSVVGAISGIFPAYSAATMDPVQAISRN